MERFAGTGRLPTLGIGLVLVAGLAAGELQGHLVIDGRPLSELTTAEPSFWFRNEATNTVPKPELVYDARDASFAVAGLESGAHFLQVTLRRDGARGMWWPGDFYGGTNFDPAAGELTVPVWEVIHLTEPSDNSTPIPHWSSDCDPKPEFPAPVRLAWDPLGCCPRGTSFQYSVHRIDCTKPWTYGDLNRVASGTTDGTTGTLDLPPSSRDDYYLLVLQAKRAGATIGQLQTRGDSGLGWDFRFRVGPPQAWLR